MAEIIFQIFDAPGRERIGVKRFVAERGRQILAGKGPVGGINAELEPKRVHLFSQRLDA